VKNKSAALPGYCTRIDEIFAKIASKRGIPVEEVKARVLQSFREQR
jgi:hypothetical protein